MNHINETKDIPFSVSNSRKVCIQKQKQIQSLQKGHLLTQKQPFHNYVQKGNQHCMGMGGNVSRVWAWLQKHEWRMHKISPGSLQPQVYARERVYVCVNECSISFSQSVRVHAWEDNRSDLCVRLRMHIQARSWKTQPRKGTMPATVHVVWIQVAVACADHDPCCCTDYFYNLSHTQGRHWHFIVNDGLVIFLLQHIRH